MRAAFRHAALPAGFAALLLLAGCGGSDTPAPTFKAPTYDYLTKLRLNVGQVQIVDQIPPPGPSDLSAQSPVQPVDAMRIMAQQRLVAAGNSGTAVFTIDQAAITGQPGGTLNGTLAAHLDIIGPSGGHNGYAEAHVLRQFVPGTNTDNDGLKTELYNLTNQMMSDMNVELEYQLRRTLGDWLLDASGAPIGATVEQQNLAPPGSGSGPSAAPAATAPALMPSSSSVGAPVQLAPTSTLPTPATPVAPMPTQATPDLNAAGPTQLAPPPQLAPQPAPQNTPPAAATVPGTSPPPGFLRLPNGYLAPSGGTP
ncbi:hypothetical protein NFI95_08020 [Acetobacteraceae bacterium KSS8]|uniref:Lipoprotein n=1 Tax=Endosaccharibacter trunci TaxID=2812733 RepID=A0ABT1W6B8_9PROT|nr:hypothetical protein [Acetobacteraceae bacterium KSS8]